MKLQVLVLITTQTPPYEKGERYTVIEDEAESLISGGRAVLVKVPEQSVEGEAVGDGPLAACASRLLMLEPRTGPEAKLAMLQLAADTLDGHLDDAITENAKLRERVAELEAAAPSPSKE